MNLCLSAEFPVYVLIERRAYHLSALWLPTTTLSCQTNGQYKNPARYVQIVNYISCQDCAGL